MLNISKLSGEPVEGIAYKSNLSSFKGSVYGGETFGVFDGFINITTWFYDFRSISSKPTSIFCISSP